MLSKNTALVVAGVFFALVAIIHIIRLAIGMQITAGGREIPVSASIGGFLITGILAVWMFAAAKQK
jgi:hypothetical protein